MTERDELEKIIIKWGLLRMGQPEGSLGHRIDQADFRNDMMSWHTKHRPQVTREAILEQIRVSHSIVHDSGTTENCGVCSRSIDYLLALLNGEPKLWCPHWKYKSDEPFGYKWHRPCGSGWMMAMEVTKFCDLCGAKRPCAAGSDSAAG